MLHLALGSPAQDRQGPVGASAEEATKLIKGIENLSYEERLSKQCFFILENKRLWGDLTVVFQNLKGAYKKNGE